MVYSFLAGLAATLGIAGPVEWAVHKYVLHSSTRPNKFIENASIAHNDNHHGAYMAPQHYYRDMTNAHVTIHFSPKNVALIAASGAGFGAAMGLGPLETAETMAGATLGILASYAMYEFNHHYMHVVGERRLQIGRIFGDYAEDGRTGNLRLPKPTLDSLCDYIEDRASNKEAIFKLRDNAEEVLAAQGITKNMDDMLNHSIFELQNWEPAHLESLSTAERGRYNRERKMHSFLRGSKLFEKLDNHHFVHHKNYGKNLNVVWMFFDKLAGTKSDSSVEALLANKKYWLCPNSPDEEPFSVKPAA